MNRLKQAQQMYEIISDWLGEGGRPVHPDHSQKRADVCLKCPKNNTSVSFESRFKGAVAAKIKRLIEIKNQMNLRVNGEKSLGVCDVCECVLKLKAHVPIKHIVENMDDVTMNDFPDDCWQKTEAKENQ